MSVFIEIIIGEETPRYKCFGNIVFKSISFFTQIFTNFTLSFKRFGSYLPLNQHKIKIVIVVNIKWKGKTLKHFHFEHW